MKKIIIKYITNTITDLELKELKVWLKDKKNQNTFEQYLKTSYDLDVLINKPDLEEAYKKIWHKIDGKKKQKVSVLPSWYNYAAAVVLVLIFSIMYIFYNKQQPVDVLNTFETTIASGVDKATLTLEDGATIALEKGKVFTTNTVVSNGAEIVYKNSTDTLPNKKEETLTHVTTNKPVAYNYLTTPRGGEFEITLADGTQVWLNSETKLKYPTSFKTGQPRQVELIYGEAYFDVSSSKNHDGATFKVLNNLQEVEVLGTEFNIKAYKDEASIYTTLAEGKVTVSNTNVKENLRVGQQSILNKKTGEMVVEVVNVYNETAWRLGSFSFKNKTLKEIMTVLSRWYNVDIVFENKELETIRFNGVLSRKMTLEEILTPIKRNANLNYVVDKKRITIK